MTTARQGLGQRGEQLARDWLLRGGWQLITTNYRCQAGEIDLIAIDGTTLVFIEVKLRRGRTWGLPEEALTLAKQQALRAAAMDYLATQAIAPPAWRIDLIAIELTADGRLARLDHYPHAVEG
jgi:putative endonuclease